MRSIIIKKVFPLILFLALFFTQCSSTKSARPEAAKIPIAINIREDKSYDLFSVNFDTYRFKVLDILDDFQEIDPVLVDEDINAEVVVDLTIDNFNILPKDERTARNAYTRNIQVGTNANGQPTYQTVTAIVTTLYTRIRSNARIMAKVTFKGSPQKVFQRTFSPNYVWENISVQDIQGDQRAAPMIPTGMGPAIEPFPDDFLLQLSKQDMLDRLSNEIRSYYRKPRN